MSIKKDIGLAIRSIRKKAGLRQKDLAVLIKPKARPETISRIETGNYNYTIDYLFAIAKALGCDVSDFCSSQDGRNPSRFIIFEFEGSIDELKERLLEKT